MLFWIVVAALSKSDSMIGQTFMLQFELLEGHFKIFLSPFYCTSLLLLPMLLIYRSDKLESFHIRGSPPGPHCVESNEVTIKKWFLERVSKSWLSKVSFFLTNLRLFPWFNGLCVFISILNREDYQWSVLQSMAQSIIYP